MQKIDLQVLVTLIISETIEWLIYSLCFLFYIFIFALFNGEWSWTGLWQTFGTALICGAGMFVYVKISNYHEGWHARMQELRRQDKEQQRKFIEEIQKLA